MCTGVEVALAIGATTAASAGVGVSNYFAGQDAAAAAKSLAAQQAGQLQAEQDKRSAEAAAQATTGATFGFGNEDPKALSTGFGFGTAPTSSPNSGRGQIAGFA